MNLTGFDLIWIQFTVKHEIVVRSRLLKKIYKKIWIVRFSIISNEMIEMKSEDSLWSCDNFLKMMEQNGDDFPILFIFNLWFFKNFA